MKRYSCFFILVLLTLTAFGQETIDATMMQRIRDEGLNHSHIMDIAHNLTDVAGPRLTNSPGYKRASAWAVGELKSWGLSNAQLEAWGTFGQGWSMEKNYIAMKAPYYQAFIGYPFAWTKGTNGLTEADVMMIPSADPDSIKKYNYDVKGKIILVKSEDTVLRSAFTAYATRYADSTLANMPDTYMFTGPMVHGMMQFIDRMKEGIRLLQQMGAVAVLHMDGEDRDGTVGISAWFSGQPDAAPDLPALELSPEDYLTMQRLLEGGTPVKMEIDIKTTFYKDDPTGYNVVAEIPGTDPKLKSQVVMLGGHLDSWFSSTGATDNGAGSAVMMEAVRILQTLGVKPKRTIRIALWSGEEQGLLGSYGYVKKHFGDPTTMKLLPEQANISCYFNLDNGTGKIRGIYAQNNDAVVPIFKKWFEPFADLDASTVTLSNTGATDHISFDAVGIPAFEFIQDPIEYETRTHHTNMDNYDHLMPDDLKQAATIVAAFVYDAAMRADKLPRKPLPEAGPWMFAEFH